MAQNGIHLLSKIAAEARDVQTLRMVAGALANLCGNGNFYSSYHLFHGDVISHFDEFLVSDRLQVQLREEGGIKALLSMTRSSNRDILAQIARGIANFAKCESRAIAQGELVQPVE
jgi:kinesin family protein 5